MKITEGKKEAAIERFCIMTTENVDDITALKYVQKKYGREIAVSIWEQFCKGKKNEN